MTSHKMIKVLGRICGLAVFLFSVSLYALDIQAAQISESSGVVTIFNVEGSGRGGLVGQAVLPDEVVETGQNSKATLLFDDGSKVEMGPNSRLKIDDQVTTGNTSIFLFLGHIFARIVPLKSEEPAFSVQTLSTTAGVRGTEFEVAAGMDGGSLVSVQKGDVDVVSEGTTVGITLKEGEEASADFEGKLARAKRADRKDVDWDRWFTARQQFFVKNPERVVNVLLRRIERNRIMIAEQDRKMAAQKKIIAAYYEQGKLTPEQIRNQVARDIDVYMRLITRLSRADNNLLGVNYILNHADEMIAMAPNAYTPEFKDQVAKARKQLAALDIAKIHKQDKQLVALHFAGVMRAAKKWNLQDEVWRDLPPKAKERIMKKWQEQETQEQHPQQTPAPRQGPRQQLQQRGQRPR